MERLSSWALDAATSVLLKGLQRETGHGEERQREDRQSLEG